jgi:Fe-S cluster assembly iron-binding protein IscA
MVSLSRRAADRIRQNRSSKKYVRLIASAAENLIAFEVEFTDSVNHDDILYMSYGIKILVGSSTRRYFEDLKVDFSGNNGAGEFKYDTTEILAAEI